MEVTLSIIKPDAVQRNLIGEIERRIEAAGLKIVALKMLWLTVRQAELFYAAHREKSFYRSLVDYMTSGPVVVQVLAGSQAVSRYRQLIGATNPTDAEPGTIRAEFAVDIERNAVHGSDSADAAASEIAFFFSVSEIMPLDYA